MWLADTKHTLLIVLVACPCANNYFENTAGSQGHMMKLGGEGGSTTPRWPWAGQ